MMLATKSTTFIIGPLATVLGWCMDLIFKILTAIGIPNVGLAIIIFSIVIFALMTPLQIKQQKFSKLSAVMQPELQKVQRKYQGKRDQDSQMRMQEETQAVYEKYGVSPTGSCAQLLIQMPILFALYQVIYRIPAYIGSVAAIFEDAVAKIMSVNGYTDILTQFMTDNSVILRTKNGFESKEAIIDLLYALSPDQWKNLQAVGEFSGFADVLSSTSDKIAHMQSFLGLNIANTPLYYMKGVLEGGSILLAIAAVLIPFLAWLTQVINIKLMPAAANDDNNQNSNTQSAMKTMNTTMPLMSAFFCITFQVGLGIYWIASAVVRSVQQVFINKYLDKVGLDEMIRENQVKAEKKAEKRKARLGYDPSKIATQAQRNVKNIGKVDKGSSNMDAKLRDEKIAASYEAAKKAAPNSIAAKANLVKAYNEKNSKKK